MNRDTMLRTITSLNRDWLFFDSGIVEKERLSHKSAYIHAKTRTGAGASSQDYDDSQWEKVDLPHDFVQRRLPEADVPGYMGCRKRGEVWYRRYFRLEESERGKNIEIRFGAAATIADVFFNGAPVYSNQNGYTSFYCDVTPMAEYGDFLNCIAVKVDASASEGWWYEGGGLYRDVWLVKRAPVHFATDGIFANPVKDENGSWIIPFEAEINNTGTQKKTVRIAAALLDPEGNLLKEVISDPVDAALFDLRTVKLTIPAPDDVKLWDPDSPVLYTVRAQLLEGDDLLDETNVRCGFRTIAFDAENGFFLNGKNVKLKGTCNHQDHGGVGVAVPKSIEYFRIRKLKEMGCNAYRCAHNPPSDSLLDVCDELGMLVMDENRHFSSAEEHLRQLQWLVKRDRNHPSVILWSLFNEEPLQCTEVGYEMTRKMSALVKKLDPTRFTTGAMNGGFLSPCNASQAMDVTGINYFIYEYDHYHEIAPDHPVLSSEDTSAVTLRGALESNFENPANQLADNDTEAVPWGATQRAAWKAIDTRPWMAGGFAWTGFDYRGEPTPFRFPANGSFFGILDHCGFPKNAFYIRQAMWRKEIPVLKIAPHWTRRDTEPGTPVKVLVISNAAEVELWINGKSQGRQKADPYDMNEYELAYEPGELKAASYAEDGTLIAETREVTAGKPAALTAEIYEEGRTAVADDAYDTVPVAIYARDDAGNSVPDAANHVRFSITDNGIIAGVANGNGNSLEGDLQPERDLFNGCAMVYVRAQRGAKGVITLTAAADGLTETSVSLKITENGADRIYEEDPPHYRTFNDWIRSPFYAEKPDPNMVLDANDMNSWEQYRPGSLMLDNIEKPYILFRAEIPDVAGKGKVIIFRNLWGWAEFYFDGQLIAEKTIDEPEEFGIRLPDFSTGTTLTVLMKADPKGQVGIYGQVIL